MFIQLKKGRDGPATLACVRADGSRTWGKEHPFFPVHDLTHCAVENVLGFDQAFFGLIATGWDIDDFTKPGASRKLPFQAIVAEHVVVVAIFVVREDAVEPLTKHLQQAVIRIDPRILQALRQSLAVSPLLIELANRQQPGITGNLSRMTLDNDRKSCKMEAELLNTLYNH